MTLEESHCGLYERAFQKHLSTRFAREAEASLRCAACVVLLAVPVMHDDSGLYVIRWLKDQGLYTQSSAIYFVFFVWSNFGDMMELVQTGMLGLVLAVLWQWLMLCTFSNGLDGDDSPAAFGAIVLSGVLYVWLISWLNFSRLTAITAIQTFVWFWMEFLDPNQVPGTKLQATNELFSATVAAGGCLAALLLPYPLLCISQAQDAARRLTRCLTQAWVDFIDCYSGDDLSAYQHQRAARHMRGLQKQLAALEVHICSAWWESRVLGSIRRRRPMLRRMDVFLRESFDRVRGAHNACRSAWSARDEEAPGCRLLAVMAGLDGSLRGVVAEVAALLGQCVHAAGSGSIGPGERGELAAQAEAVRGLVRAVSEQFFELRAGGGPDDGLSLEMKSVHAFCLELCAYGRLAAGFAEDLLRDASGECPLPLVGEAPWFGEIFDTRVLFSSEQVVTALRHTAKILLAFFFGYRGVPHFYTSYDAGAANVMGVMLNRAALGSELEKNLARMQGAVIGTIVGDLGGALFVGCGWMEQTGKHVLLFFLAAGSFFLYFHATRYADSYLGFILIFFACKALIKRCDVDAFSYRQFYFDIVDIVAALVIILALDTLCDVLSRRRPSRMACRAHREGWRHLRESLAQLLDPDASPVIGQPLVERARCSFAAAAAVGAEAALEPRYWRAAWPAGLFETALEHADRVLLALSRLRYTATSQAAEGEATSAFFCGLLQSEAFRGAGRLLEGELRVVEEKLAQVFEHELEDEPSVLQDPGLWDDQRAAWGAAVRELVQEVSHLQQVPTVRYSLEEDPVAQVCLIVESMEEMMAEMQRLHEAVLQAA